MKLKKKNEHKLLLWRAKLMSFVYRFFSYLLKDAWIDGNLKKAVQK